MKKALLSIIAAVASGMVYAAPAPYPLTINSQAQTAPPVLVYRASETAFRVRFTDGATASDISGCIPFMAWSTNANATGVSTSSYSIVSATNGMVDFNFDQSAVNFAAGRYLYEVGVRSNAVPRVYRQGIFQIYNSPVGAGVSAVTWSTPVNWLLLDWSNLPTITVNGVTGSIETNLSFTVTGSSGGSVTSVNGQTGTVTITASGLGALTNETDTLALEALSTNKVTKVFDTTGTRWIDGTGGVWQVSVVTNSAMANWHVTVISDIKNGAGSVVATNLTDEVFDDPIGIPPLSLGQYAIQNVVRGGYRWSIYRASDANQLTVFVQNIGASTSQYLSQSMNPPTYTNAICTAWPGGLSAGQCRVTYTPIVVTVSVVTSALPRMAFMGDIPTTPEQVGAYPSSNPSNYADYVSVTNIVLANLTTTADIRTPLVNVTTGATSTVTVTSAKRVYYVESAVQTTVTNDISALALNCTSNAEWEVWYNATSTNALTPLWDSRMTFAGGNPDMTVTGVYKFALSSPCGTIIQARQTWPTVFDWQVAQPMGKNQSFGTALFHLAAVLTASTDTNTYNFFSLPVTTYPQMLRIYGFFNAGPSHFGTNSPTITVSGQRSYSGVVVTSGWPSAAAVPTNQTGFVMSSYVPAFVSASAEPCLIKATYGTTGFGAGTSALTVIPWKYRKMNEIETAAFNFGWRPTP